MSPAPLPPLATSATKHSSSPYSSSASAPSSSSSSSSSSSIEAYAAHALARKRQLEPPVAWREGTRFNDCRDIVSVYDLDPTGSLSGLKSCSATFRAIHNIAEPVR